MSGVGCRRAPVLGTELFPGPLDGTVTDGVPVVVGTTRDEWLGVWGAAPAGALPPPDLAAPFRAKGLSADAVRKAYASRGYVSDTALFAAFDTDRFFRRNAVALADELATRGAPVWSYRLDWAPTLDHGSLGAYHALDLALVFGSLHDERSTGANPPVGLAREMHQAWANFARHGDPNGSGVPPWPRYDVESRSTLLFDQPSRVEEDPDQHTRRLWDDAL